MASLTCYFYLVLLYHHHHHDWPDWMKNELLWYKNTRERKIYIRAQQIKTRAKKKIK